MVSHDSFDSFPPVLSITQAANLLQVPVGTLYEWRSKGKLNCCSARRGKHVRILRDRLLQWFFGAALSPVAWSRGCDRLQVREGVTIYRRHLTWHVRFARNGQDMRRTLRTKDQVIAEHRALRLWKRLRGCRARRKQATLHGTVKAYLAYVRTEQRAAKTIAKYEWSLKQFEALAAREQVHRLSQVNVALLDKYRSKRASSGVAAKTLFNESVVIKQLMNFAVSRGMLKANPLRAYKLKKPKSKLQPFWTIEQVQQILNESKMSRYHGVFTVLAETGMRIAEVKYLTWDDVNLEQNVIYVRDKQVEGKRNAMWKPKTGNHRIVPLSPHLIELFGSLSRRSYPWVFTRAANSDRNAMVCPINERSVLTHLKKILKKLMLPGHVHTFRHSFISYALIRGVPEALVRQWVGHVDPLTIRSYSHIADRDSHAQMQKLFGRVAIDRDSEPRRG